MSKPTMIAAMLLLSCFSVPLLAQQATGDGPQLPGLDRALLLLSAKTLVAEEKLGKASGKYLEKLRRQEEKLRKKIERKDSALAEQVFGSVDEAYALLQEQPQQTANSGGSYFGRLDSLVTSLNFLNKEDFSGPPLNASLAGFSALQAKLEQADGIKAFLGERKRVLRQVLEKLGMLKELKGFSKQAYYYSAQIRAYKALWEEPSKLERKLLDFVLGSEGFREFFRANSGLASLFASPGGNTTAAVLAGLQTRASVQQAITARFGTGTQVQQVLQQNIQAAQEQLNQLKQKLSQYGTRSYGNSGGDIDVPEGFSPNSQKTKTFFQRLEYGVNVQSQKSRSYFPVTSDIGFSLGYKLNDKSSLGIGAAYKLGWGHGWNNIRLTHEGVGLRSYVGYRLKENLYVTGGYEQSYRTAFSSVEQLKNYAAWQTSGLLGLGKRYKVRQKLKGEMKLLWDFLSYRQVPRTQAILFRIGYNIK